MLALLERYGAKATFFVIGEKAAAHPELLREILHRGHTLGNHTHTHPLASFWLAGPERTAREIGDCDAALQRGAAVATKWFRAPAGIKTLFLRGILAQRQRVLIGWSARARENFGGARAAPLRRLTKDSPARRDFAPARISRARSGTRGAAFSLARTFLRHGYQCVLPRRESLR